MVGEITGPGVRRRDHGVPGVSGGEITGASTAGSAARSRTSTAARFEITDVPGVSGGEITDVPGVFGGEAVHPRRVRR